MMSQEEDLNTSRRSIDLTTLIQTSTSSRTEDHSTWPSGPLSTVPSKNCWNLGRLMSKHFEFRKMSSESATLRILWSNASPGHVRSTGTTWISQMNRSSRLKTYQAGSNV